MFKPITIKIKKILVHPLFLLLLLGFIIRVSLVFIDYSFDVNSFMAWGREADKYGFAGFYERPSREQYSTVYPNYPPLAIFLFYSSFKNYQLVDNAIWNLNIKYKAFPSRLVFFIKQRSTMAAFFKRSSILADLGIAVIVYLFTKKLLKKKSRKSQLVTSTAILFNPAFFYTSALWGQIESIPILLILLSFYCLLYTPFYLVSFILMTLAILTKQSALIFIPIFFVAFLKKYDFSKFIKSLFVSLLLFWLLFFPFFKKGNLLIFPFQIYWQKIASVSSLPFLSNHAANFWAFVSQWQNIADKNIFLGVSFHTWGFLLMGIFSILILYRAMVSKFDDYKIIFAAALLAMTGFMFLTRIHERHIQQVLPFILLLGILKKKYMKIYIILSAVYLFNLYHNWAIPNVGPVIYFVRLPSIVNLVILSSIAIYLVILKDYLTGSKPLEEKG